jgi:hypothetical protein
MFILKLLFFLFLLHKVFRIYRMRPSLLITIRYEVVGQTAIKILDRWLLEKAELLVVKRVKVLRGRRPRFVRSVDSHADWGRAFLLKAAASIYSKFVFWHIKIFRWAWRFLSFINLLMVSCISTVMSEVSVSVLNNTWLFSWNRSITRKELALVIWEPLISLHRWLTDVSDTYVIFILL